MPSFKLNGQEIPFEPGDTIIRAAWRKGIEIPHYCWHPGLSVAANCRMCLVEIRSQRPMLLPVLRWDEASQNYVDTTKPKLQPACQMAAAEGLEVYSTSDEVKKAQSSVQEFLLLNHPVDCPICDQAGECKLQDYWLDYQGTLKRKHTEPVHKPKAVRFGPTIVYDAERCIMCTRCIRFSDEVAHDHVLDMRERGNRNEITVSQGRELDHGYTLMTEHVCPVGALTSRDFRFKARVWFLRAAPSVCSGCSTGCNSFMDYDPRSNKVERIRPRDNEDINAFWMCDDGMMTYKRLYEGRITSAQIRKNNVLEQSTYNDAISAAAMILKEMQKGAVGVVLSAQHSNEDNFALSQFAEHVLHADALFLSELGGWQGDDILKDADNNPNRRGAEKVAGKSLSSVSHLVEAVHAKKILAVVALGFASKESQDDLRRHLSGVPVINLTSHEGAWSSISNVVISVAAHGETHGTFINKKGMSQAFKPAVKPAPGVKEVWEALGDLAAALGATWSLSSFAEVRRALKPASSQSVNEQIGAAS